MPTAHAEMGTNMWKSHGPGGTRTRDLEINGLLLYHLSQGYIDFTCNNCGIWPMRGYAVYSQ